MVTADTLWMWATVAFLILSAVLVLAVDIDTMLPIAASTPVLAWGHVHALIKTQPGSVQRRLLLWIYAVADMCVMVAVSLVLIWQTRGKDKHVLGWCVPFAVIGAIAVSGMTAPLGEGLSAPVMMTLDELLATVRKAADADDADAEADADDADAKV